MDALEHITNRNLNLSPERFEEMFSRPTLHLNLTKKWFDKIYSGEKTEEYREIKQYWIRRLFRFYKKDPLFGLSWPNEFNIIDPNDPAFESALIGMKKHGELHSYIYYSNAFPSICYDISNLNKYKTITFSNGMAKDANRMVIACKGIQVKEGKEDWGAEKGKSYFVLSLGDFIWSNF